MKTEEKIEAVRSLSTQVNHLISNNVSRKVTRKSLQECYKNTVKTYGKEIIAYIGPIELYTGLGVLQNTELEGVSAAIDNVLYDLNMDSARINVETFITSYCEYMYDIEDISTESLEDLILYCNKADKANLLHGGKVIIEFLQSILDKHTVKPINTTAVHVPSESKPPEIKVNNLNGHANAHSVHMCTHMQDRIGPPAILSIVELLIHELLIILGPVGKWVPNKNGIKHIYTALYLKGSFKVGEFSHLTEMEFKDPIKLYAIIMSILTIHEEDKVNYDDMVKNRVSNPTSLLYNAAEIVMSISNFKKIPGCKQVCVPDTTLLNACVAIYAGTILSNLSKNGYIALKEDYDTIYSWYLSNILGIAFYLKWVEINGPKINLFISKYQLPSLKYEMFYSLEDLNVAAVRKFNIHGIRSFIPKNILNFTTTVLTVAKTYRDVTSMDKFNIDDLYKTGSTAHQLLYLYEELNTDVKALDVYRINDDIAKNTTVNAKKPILHDFTLEQHNATFISNIAILAVDSIFAFIINNDDFKSKMVIVEEELCDTGEVLDNFVTRLQSLYATYITGLHVMLDTINVNNTNKILQDRHYTLKDIIRITNTILVRSLDGKMTASVKTEVILDAFLVKKPLTMNYIPLYTILYLASSLITDKDRRMKISIKINKYIYKEGLRKAYNVFSNRYPEQAKILSQDLRK